MTDTPSPGRTIYLLPPSNAAPVPGITPQSALQWPAKTTADILDSTLDCTAFLADADNDLINTGSVTIAASPNDLIATPDVLTETALTWIFSGGTAGTTYDITVTFGTLAGLMVSRICYMTVVSV